MQIKSLPDKKDQKKEQQGSQFNQGKFEQQNYFREIFQQDLDQEQRKILDRENIFDLADFFFKIEKTFFKKEVDKQKFEFFKFLSGILKMDDDKLMPILKKLNEKAIYSQQAFTSTAESQKIGIEQQIIDKIKNEIQKKNVSSQNSNFLQSTHILDKSKLQEKQHQSLLDTLKNQCKQIQEKGQQKIIFEYPTYDPKQLQNLNNYKTILVIGQKGSGKSSFLNYLLNVYLGVQYEDDFRFIFQKSDQPTNDISVRYIQQFREKAGLILIDTPGFNDDLDQKTQNNAEKIQQYLQTGYQIDCICLVLHANIIRLNSAQILFFNNVVRNFGEQIFPYLKFIFSFSMIDDQVPQSMQAIRFKGDQLNQESPFAKYYNQMTNPIYFKVNCQNILSQNVQQNLQSYYWNMTFQSISDFYLDIFNSQKTSIRLMNPLKLEQQKIKIQELVQKACEVKGSLTNMTKLYQRYQSTNYGQDKAKKDEEEEKMKNRIFQLRNDLSIHMYQCQIAIQDHCKSHIQKTVIQITEELEANMKIDNQASKKIMPGIIESLQQGKNLEVINLSSFKNNRKILGSKSLYLLYIHPLSIKQVLFK
ncbi:hypothetical protein pb186bvf_000380 [Paramecium bursaria]